MRKRLLFAVGAAVVPLSAGLVALTPTVASATAPSPVTVVRDPAPLTTAATLDGLTFYHQVGGGDPNAETGNVAVVAPPVTPPLGTGALRLGVGSNGDTGVALFDQSYLNYYFSSDYSVIIPFPVVYNPAALFLKFGYLETATDAPAEVQITLWHGGAPVNFYEMLPTDTAWQTFDIGTAPLLQDGGDGVTTKTITEWAQPGDSLFSVYVGVMYDGTYSNPNPDKVFYVDDLTYGFGVTLGMPSIHPVTEFDFETNTSAPTLTPTVSKSTIDAGGSSSVAVHVTSGDAGIPSAHMQLWAKPSGASDFSKVASVDTDSDGVAASTQKPKKNTVYRWRYMGTDTNPEIPGVDSTTKSVGVRDAVSAHAADATLTPAQKLKITGGTLPAKAGATLTVQRIIGGTSHKFGTATADGTGHYSFTHAALAKGTYVFRVAVPALSGNLAGVSPKVTVTVA